MAGTDEDRSAMVHLWGLAVRLDHDAYNQVSAAENWVSNFNSGNNADFQDEKGDIKIAQLTLGLGNVQNQMVFTIVSGSSGVTPEPSTFVIWSLLGPIESRLAGDGADAQPRLCRDSLGLDLVQTAVREVLEHHGDDQEVLIDGVHGLHQLAPLLVGHLAQLGVERSA